MPKRNADCWSLPVLRPYWSGSFENAWEVRAGDKTIPSDRSTQLTVKSANALTPVLSVPPVK